MRLRISLFLSVLLGLPAAVLAQPAPDELGGLKFRHIGPVGNRTLAVAGVPGDRNVYYAGAATGGIWKTEDAGLKWRPVFDDQDVHAVGALAVSESDPNIVWAGTGETFIRANVSIGIGVFKSTDAGETWQHMGLDATARIMSARIHRRAASAGQRPVFPAAACGATIVGAAGRPARGTDCTLARDCPTGTGPVRRVRQSP